MFEIHYDMIIATIAALWLLNRIIVYRKRKQINCANEIKIACVFVCVAVILRFTFFPFDLVNGQMQTIIFDSGKVFPFRINWVPFVHLLDYEGSIRFILINLIGNTAMFIPIGIIVPITFPKLNCFYKVAAVGFLISFLIEVLQLPFASRVSDIDDLILNTIGCALGYSFYHIAHKIKGLKQSKR